MATNTANNKNLRHCRLRPDADHALNSADSEAAERRTGHAAQSTEDNDDKCLQQEARPHGGMRVIERQ